MLCSEDLVIRMLCRSLRRRLVSVWWWIPRADLKPPAWERCRHPAHCHKGEQASPALCSEQPRINSGVKEVVFPSENLARARRLPMAENEGEKSYRWVQCLGVDG